MPYRQNFPIPSEIDPPTFCLCLEIPNNPEWKAVVAGLLGELRYWFNWERTGDDSGAQCAAVWKRLYDEIDWSTMSCCCGEFTIIFQWTEDGVLQQSSDGGVTWIDAPEQDPRNSSPTYPPVSGESSDDKKCIAATGMTMLIKEGIGDQLTDEMGRYTLLQLIQDWVGTILQTSNPFQALVNIVVNQIFALLISAVRAALTEGVYDQLTCIFFCNMEDDLSFTEGEWEAVRSAVLSEITGIAGVFLEHLVFLLGKIGLTNLARSQAATEGDCSECSCDDNCGPDGWLLGTIVSGSLFVVGTEDARDSDSVTATSADRGDGQQWIYYTTGLADACCDMTVETLSGAVDTVNGIACGTSPENVNMVSLGLSPPDNLNTIGLKCAGVTQVKITFNPLG